MNNSYLSSIQNALLLSKPSTTIRLLLMVLFVCLFGNRVNAANRFSVATGNWNSPTTWSATSGGASGATVPAAGDVVYIEGNFNVTITANTACTTLNIASGSSLAVGAFDISVSGVTIVSGTLTHTSSIGTTKRYTGSVTINPSGVWNNSGNANINLRGGLTNNGDFTAGTGTHTFDTGNQTLTGIITIPRVTVNGITLTNNGTLTVATALAGTGTGTLINLGTLATGGAISVATLNNSGTINHSGSGGISTVVAKFNNTGTLNLNGSGQITGGITNNAAGIVNLASSGKITSFNNATATSTLNISAITVPTITTLTVSAAGNTVNYNGFGNQTVQTVAYSNLILSGSGTKTFAVTTINKDLTLSGTATTTTGNNLAIGGNLSVNTGSSLTTGSNFTLRVTGTTSITGTVTLANTGAKTFTNDVTVNTGGTWNETGIAAINYGGDLQNNGTYTASTGVHTFSGTTKTISGTSSISIPSVAITGTITNNGTLTVNTALSGNGTLIQGQDDLLNIGGTSSISTLTATAAGNTVNYTGTAQTINVTTYRNLILSGSGTKTLAADTTVNEDITIATGVTLDIKTSDLDVSGNIILNGTCESSSEVVEKGKVDWINEGTLYGTGTFSNIDQLETNGNITIDSNATITFNNATIDGQGKTITNKGIVNVTGTGSFAIDALTWNNIGTLNYGLSTIPAAGILTLYANTSGNTVNYTGTAQNQNIIPSTYYNLTLSGLGTKTFGADTAVDNTLSIATGIVANLGTFIHTAGVLILGGEDAFSGSWGSTSSAAVNKDNTYFAATVGTINYSCSPPIITTPPVAKTICENTGESFTVATSTVNSTFQWQYSINSGSSWANITAVSGISGYTLATLTLSNIPATYNGYRFRCIVRSNSGCRTSSNSVLLTVNATPTLAGASQSATVCPGSAATINLTGLIASSTSTVAYTINGVAQTAVTGVLANASGAASFTSAALTAANNGQTLQITGITRTNAIISCTASFAQNVTMAVNSTPTIGITTQPTCTKETGSVVLNGLPASGTWNLYQNGNATPIVTGGSGTSTTISDLAVGDYTFTVSSGACISSSSASVSINSLDTNTWTTVWSKGTPNSNQKLVFTANYPPTQGPNEDITGCSCMVTGAIKVTITSGKTLTITNEVKVVSGGTLIFEDTASLVQKNDNAVNVGVIKYQRITAPIRQTDYTYWSSPVTPVAGGGYPLGSIATSQNYLSYDSSTNDWKYENASTQMTKGVGYAIQGPSTMAGSPYSTSFVGVPNNEIVTVPVIFTNSLNLLPTNPNYGVSYLLGNPYPSAIDANAFLTTNVGKLDGTLYFWTHNTEIGLSTSNLGSGALAFTSDDYASYNYTGGVSGTGYAAPTIGSGAIAKDIPTGKIAAGQGFFATSIATGNVIFNNSMRLSGTTNSEGTGTNQQFFKTKNSNTKTAKAIEKNRVWLNLSNTQGAFKQTLVGYITGATNDYDNFFDGESFDGNEFVDFYSINQDKDLTIQGRALPFDENDEVPLGYRTTINGEFTINIDQVDGSLANQAVFIEDKLTNTVFDLKSGNYTFNTVAGTFNDRFVLKYTNKTLSIDETDKEDGILVLYSNNYKTLIIHNNDMDTTVNSVALFNITGQNIANWEVNDFEQTNIQFPIKNISSGIYIVKVKTTKGESSKKIIVRE